MSYLFSKKIKCIDCDGNYRGINERGKRKYYCSSYHNYRTCTRWNVEETYLIELIYNHYKIDQFKTGVVGTSKRQSTQEPQIDLEMLLDRVKGIEVTPKEKTITIQFKDGTSTMMTPTRHGYYVE